jgi:hypothetical protein
MAERVLARFDVLVAERRSARAAELRRHLIGEVVVGDEADLAFGVGGEHLRRRAQLHADAGRRRIERLGFQRLRRRQARVHQLARTGDDAGARCAVLDPKLQYLQLGE